MKWPSLEPVQQITLADGVTDQIRDGIITGQLRPGERLAEPELAALFQVSRSPVREALRRLEQEGLVVREANRSCYVWRPTTADVDEIFSLRTMLESLAAELIINELNEDDFNYLHEAIERQRQLIADNKSIELIHEDMSFHEYLCRRTGHTRLLEWWNQIISQWKMILYQRMQRTPQEIMPLVVRDHEAIVDAFRRQDLAEVIRLHRSINKSVTIQSKEALRLLWLETA
jgi:DNA-binding GntR family transcriptional regulator